MNIIQFSRIVQSIASVINFFREIGLLKKDLLCCRKQCALLKHKSKDGEIFRCRVCRKKKSIRLNSFFSKSHLRITVLFSLLYFFAIGENCSQVAKHLSGELSLKSVIQWFTYLREICSLYLLSKDNIKLGGPGTVVQIDETFIRGKRKYKKGNKKKRAERKILFGIIDTSTKRILIEIVPDRKKWTLLPIILRHVLPGTEIHSDEARSYFCLKHHGYIHKTVKHKAEYKSADGTHTNNIENVWSHVKYQNKNTRGTYVRKFPLYIDEFIYKWNRKLDGDEGFFENFVKDIADNYLV